MNAMSPFEIINEILKDGNPRIAREIAKKAREMGLDWSRENANSALYKMLRSSLVVKIETEKAPKWILPEFAPELAKLQIAPKKYVISYKSKKIPLEADSDLTIKIQGVEIQFQFDQELSPNDPYMSGDWLNQKIFVTVNGNHPFYQSYINTDEAKKLFIFLAAEEVFVQWKVAKQNSKITAEQLLEIRDFAMRNLVHDIN